MPELPEVETVRRGLETAVMGRVIARAALARADLRVPFPPGFAETLQGKRIEAVERRAKYLLIRLSEEWVWMVHLGMSGRFTAWREPPAPAPHDHVRIDFHGGGGLLYNDARRFGLMTLAHAAELAEHPLLAHLGAEPLSEEFTAAYLRARLAGKRVAIKIALMDARVVVGVGNIYACEALFAARVNPFMPACDAAAQAEVLVKAVRTALFASSGSSTTRNCACSASASSEKRM